MKKNWHVIRTPFHHGDTEDTEIHRGAPGFSVHLRVLRVSVVKPDV